MLRLEEEEQRHLARVLDAQPGVVWCHVGNERASRVGRLIQAQLGTKPGVPDAIIVRPLLAALELKRPRGPRGGRPGEVSADQVWWLEQLAAAGFAEPRVPGQEDGVCYGAEEALDWLLPLIREAR